MKIKKLFVLCILVLCLFQTTAYAQAFSKYGVTNPNGTTTFYAITNSLNTKIYEGKSWKVKATLLTFSSSISGTSGLAFVPMVKNSAYMLCGGKKVWATGPTGGYLYGGWDSGRGEVGDYYLGTRLDTRLTSCSASVAGDWNSN
ncbi:MAG: hypothetical protein ACI4EK_02520 [Wujia sp.]